MHLHPNSVLLLSIFAYYCEAYLGIMPSVALLRHFFFLRVSGKANSISNTGKKAVNLRAKWVMMGAKCIHPRLALPTEMPQSDEGWLCAKLTDDRAKLVLEKMNTDLRPSNLGAAELTGATLLREFLEHRLALLR